MTGTPSPLPVPGASLGEGPCWDAASGSLYWVDIEVGRVLRLDGGGAFRGWDVGQAVGAVLGRPSGGPGLAARGGLPTPRPEGRAGAPLATRGLPAGCPMNHRPGGQAGRVFAGS